MREPSEGAGVPAAKCVSEAPSSRYVCHTRTAVRCERIARSTSFFRSFMKYVLPSVLVLSSFVIAACSADDPPAAVPVAVPTATATATNPPVDPPPPSVPVVEWGKCKINSEGEVYQVDCASVDMPARRTVAGSGTIPVAVYRVKSAKRPATRQLWMLNGGPGGSGAEIVSAGDLVARSFKEAVDVYLVDHRGTGESSFMECPTAEETSTATQEFGQRCSDELRAALGDKADGFSTTEAASDVRDLIKAMRAPDQKVILYGVSYGSYWAHRFLQLPDIQIDGVITEGNCLGSTCGFDTPQQFRMDEVMKNVLEACKEDEDCTAHLGADPWQFATDTLALLANGHCSAAKFTERPLGDVVFEIGPIWPQGTLPLLYRLNRCNAGDVVALDEFQTKLAEITGGGLHVRRMPRLGPPPKVDEDHVASGVLGAHVIASELISRPAPSKNDLAALVPNLLFKADPDVGNELYDGWKPYPRDAYVGDWAKNVTAPWLVLQGDFDFQTVHSLTVEAMKHITAPKMQYVRVPGGNHSVVFDEQTCALQMMEAFVESPTAKVDTSCMATFAAKRTKLDPDFVAYFIGSGDGWD